MDEIYRVFRLDSLPDTSNFFVKEIYTYVLLVPYVFIYQKTTVLYQKSSRVTKVSSILILWSKKNASIIGTVGQPVLAMLLCLKLLHDEAKLLQFIVVSKLI